MEPVLSGRAARRARTTALVAALSLVVAPLVAAPAAVAATDPPSGGQAAVEQGVVADVVAPAPEDLELTGTLQVGEQVTVDPRADRWTPSDVELSISYRWLADGLVADELAAGTENTLTVPVRAVGHVLSVEITGTAPDGASATVVVAAAGAVVPGAFVPGDLQVAGDARVGGMLTASTGTWVPAVDPVIEWRRGDVVVGTGATYTPAAADAGSALTVLASGRADGYEDATVTFTTAQVAVGTLTPGTPSVSGTPQVGKTLTAVPGSWKPAATITYRWLRSGSAISGATSATYKPTAADVGKAVAVEVTGKAAGYGTETRRSASRTVTAGALVASTPTLSGTVRVGSKVTAKPGTWTSGTALTYRWYASGKAISGATGSTYTPSAGVKGKTLTVRVTGTRSGYTTTTKASAGKTVGAGVLTAPRPKISGVVRVGAKVSVSRGTWSPSASTYRYQWRVNGAKISGATKSSYTVPSKYAGKSLTVTVTGSRSGYSTKSVTSASAKVLRVYSRTSAPKISGSARVGSTLKVASRGTWSPAPSSWKYQWRANGTPIEGATRSSLKLTGAQYGKRITVTIAGVRSGYYASARTSAATAAVAAPAAVLTKDGAYKVGTGIAPGTYITAGSSEGCYFERRSAAGSSLSGVIANSFTLGQTIVTVKSTDKYFVTSGCGTWRRYYAYGSVRTTTAVDGIYRVGTAGGQLKPGLYYTAGSVDGYGCYVASMASFSGELGSILENDYFDGSGYWQVLPGDVAFETSGCSWRRVSS